MRLVQGYWNGILLDMCIETIFMRIEKGSGGIVRVILKQGVVKKWVNSLHICTEILKDLNKMRDQEICKYLEFHRKKQKTELSGEEYQGGPRDTLKNCIIH